MLFSLVMSSKKHAFSLAASLYVRAVAETREDRRGTAARAVARNRILRNTEDYSEIQRVQK